MAAIVPSHTAPASHPLSVKFAQGIALDGYDVRQSGGVLTVTPHWTASATPPRPYTAFVHVLDAAGHLIAQDDAPPLAGRFPTTYWQTGDVIPDSHAIMLPANLVPGTYHLEFGLYDSKTLVGLPVLSGQPVADVTLPAGR